jgi:hypothetical protein
VVDIALRSRAALGDDMARRLEVTRQLGLGVALATTVLAATACSSQADEVASSSVRKVTSALMAAPTLLATAPAQDTVKLLWNDVPGNSGVWVDRSTNGGIAWSAILQQAAGSTSWLDSSASADTAYCYRVRVQPTTLAPTSNMSCVTTPVGLEAETATSTLSPGGTATVVADAAASRAQVLRADLGSTGYVELSTSLPETGRYRVKAVFQTGADRAIAQLSIDGVDQGAAFDSYANGSGIVEADLGDVDISKVGVSKKLRFRVTGKNAAASGYKLGLDVVKLYNSGRRDEAETSNPTASSGDSRAAVADTSASGGKVDVSQLNATGDYFKVTVPVVLAGDYRLVARYKKGPDRGKFQGSLDAANVGGVIDGYASTATYVLADLGPVTIATANANHEIRFTAAGKNGSATSYGVSVDYVELRPAQGAQQLSGYVVGAKATAPLVGPVPAATVVDLAITMPVRNRAGLDAFVRQISDPASATFGQGLTPAQFTSSYGPTAADYQALVDWAQAAGLTVVQTYSNRTLLDVRGSADAVNKALFVNLVYRQRADGTPFFVADREPSIGIAPSVLWIGGLDNFVRPKRAAGSGVLSEGVGAYLGTDFRRAYASCGTHLKGAGQRVGIFALAGINVADVAAYETANGGSTHVPVTIDSANPSLISDGGDFAFEVTMDAEMAVGMAPGLDELVIFQASNLESALGRMASRQPLCNQLSSSFEVEFSTGAQQHLTTLAAQNQSFFTSSGDDGSYSNSPTSSRALSPQTIVGGTALTMNGAGASYASETTWNEDLDSRSGGGIITFGGLPEYQQGISMATNGGSTTARNVPDVAAAANNVEVIAYYAPAGMPATTGPWLSGGTSASAPLWAGFMALVNEQRQAASRKPLGFVNPALYGISKVASIYSATFNDIQDNSNNGSFHAVAGYDLTAGVGTPKCNLLYQLSSELVTTPVPTNTITISGTITLDITYRDGTTATNSVPANAVVHLGITNPTGFYSIIADPNMPAQISGQLRLAPGNVDTLITAQGFRLGQATSSIPGKTVPGSGSATLGGTVTGSFAPTLPYESVRMTWILTAQSSQP